MKPDAPLFVFCDDIYYAVLVGLFYGWKTNKPPYMGQEADRDWKTVSGSDTRIFFTRIGDHRLLMGR